MFQASKNATEGTGFNYLDIPYLGPCKIKDLSVEEINNTTDCFKVTFGDLTGPDYNGDPVGSGTTHEHVEWSPSSQDTPEKTQNKIDRIAYIAGRVAPKEAVEAIQANNWKDYINAVIQLMKQHQASQKQLYMKAMGDVYNGKTRVKFPGYRSFLSATEGDLSWSAKEKGSNKKYMDALNAPASSANDEEVVDDIEKAQF